MSRFCGLLPDSNVNVHLAFCSVAIARRSVIFDVCVVHVKRTPSKCALLFLLLRLALFRKTLSLLKTWIYVGLYHITKLYSVISNIIKTCME